MFCVVTPSSMTSASSSQAASSSSTACRGAPGTGDMRASIAACSWRARVVRLERQALFQIARGVRARPLARQLVVQLRGARAIGMTVLALVALAALAQQPRQRLGRSRLARSDLERAPQREHGAV